MSIKVAFSLREQSAGAERGRYRWECTRDDFLTQSGFWQGGFAPSVETFKVIWRLLLAEGFLPDSAEAGRSSVCILEFMLWDLWSVLTFPSPVVPIIYKLEGMVMESNCDWTGLSSFCSQMIHLSLWSPQSLEDQLLLSQDLIVIVILYILLSPHLVVAEGWLSEKCWVGF